ncbi:MAG: 6-bladed beta-propeller [Bacteroidales bacterium]
MKNKSLVLFISLLTYASCNSNKEVLTVDINFSNISNGAFSDYYSLEQMIPLETTDSSVFDCDYVDEYIFSDNKIYVGVDESKDIKVFNTQGKYLHAINRSGNGPQEYGPEYRSLCLVDSSLLVRNYNAEMIYYDLKGNFIRKLKQPLSVWSNQVGVLPDGNLIANKELNGLTAYTHDSVLSKTPYYSVQIYSSQGKLLKNLLERPKFSTNLYIELGHTIW